MSEPACRIEWFHDGYRAVWLYDGTNDWDRFEGLCRAIGLASADEHTLAALTAAIEQAARDAKLHVRVYPGPSHADPLQTTVRVGVFAEPPPDWSPPA